MAALALIGASSILIGRGFSAPGAGREQESSPPKSAKAQQDPPAKGDAKTQGPKAEKAKAPAADLPSVELNLAIAGILLFGLHPATTRTPAALLIPLALFAFAGFSWIVMRTHDRRLCEPCMRSMPLDAAKTAERYKRRFRTVHLADNRTLVLGYVALLVAGDVLWLRAGMSGRIVWAVVESSMFYLVFCYSSHRRFQPWCPECRGGDTYVQPFVPQPLPAGQPA